MDMFEKKMNPSGGFGSLPTCYITLFIDNKRAPVTVTKRGT